MLRHFIPPTEIQRIREFITNDKEKWQTLALSYRLNILDMIQGCGSGHLGTCFSIIDVLTYLYEFKLNDPNRLDCPQSDTIIPSKGHDVPAWYAVLIGKEVIPHSKHRELRRYKGLPGHPECSTPGFCANTGSLGMGLSKGLGHAWIKKQEKEAGRTYIVVGDGELQEGQNWEALMFAAHKKLNITLLIDSNKYQSKRKVSETCSLGDLKSKLESFHWKTMTIDGHSFDEISKAFSQNQDGPQAIVLNTLKGKGHRLLELNEREYPYHSGPLPQDVYDNVLTAFVEELERKGVTIDKKEVDGEAKDSSSEANLISEYSSLLSETNHQALYVLSGDLENEMGLNLFASKNPERFIECGIAEQNMVSLAGALTKRGKLPLVHSFSAFLTSRANEQIYNNAAERDKVIYVGGLSGILPSTPGSSHQSTRDIALMRSIPSLTIVQPNTKDEMRMAFQWAIYETQNSVFFRLFTPNFHDSLPPLKKQEFGLGKGREVLDGDEHLCITYSPHLSSKLYQIIGQMNESETQKISLVTTIWPNSLDNQWWKQVLEKHSHVYIIEDHSRPGSFAEMLSCFIAEEGIKLTSFKTQHIEGIPECGDHSGVEKYYKIDKNSLKESLKKFLNPKEIL